MGRAGDRMAKDGEGAVRGRRRIHGGRGRPTAAPAGRGALPVRAGLAGALFLAAAFPAGLLGQAGREAGTPPEEVGTPASAYVTAFAGLLAPLNDLTADPTSFGTAVTSSVALGVEAAFWLGRRWGVGLQGVYAPADLSLKPSPEFQGVVPENLGGADYLAGGVSVLHRFSFAGPATVIEPYFGAGLGVRRLSVDPIAQPEVEDRTGVAGTLTGGAFVPISRVWAVRLEVRDWVSSFESPTTTESRLQNDIAVTVGLGAAIF